jgi:eukaryotic-like serine/threonine-protein kinase
MPLAPGTQVGPFQITASLGAGGMGEVYRASDVRLKREVALKVLPEAFAHDSQRMARFEREAQVLASLNHTHIAHLHGLEESNGIRALVIELVEGSTLAERIAKGPIPVEEAAEIAKQIAEALEYAHDKGIIHRDLKPTNIKIGPNGQVKVLDFGLAKAMETDGGELDISTSPTISIAASRAGMLLGTAAYMSPEQAKGKSVDRRADIWAFGCVLFEMLTGEPAFGGETITDTLAAVVRADPEWEHLPGKVPAGIRDLLRRCLIKDPRQRLQAIGEARIVLEKYMADPDAEAEVVRAAPNANRERLLAGVAAIAILLAIVFGLLYWNRAPAEVRPVRSSIQPAARSTFVFGGRSAGIALSPDGRRLAYVGSGADGKAVLWVRPLDSLQAQPLAGTEGAGHPFWSPDSHFIGFFADEKLKKIEASGGPPLALCDAHLGRGGTWNRDGIIVFAPTSSGPLYRVSASGGAATPLTTLDPSKGETSHRWPFFLPDGRHFLYLAGTPYTPKDIPSNSVLVGSLDSRDSKFLLHTRSGAIYASGHILFLRENTLMAQPFDTKTLTLTGDAVPIADPVQEDEARILGTFSASQTGSLVYAEGVSSQSRELIWMDRAGKKMGGLSDRDAYDDVAISPDGRRLSFTLQSSGSDIWTYDIARGVKTRLTFGSASAQSNASAVWSPDGTRIAYTSVRAAKFGIYQKPADGSGSEQLLVEPKETPQYPTDWSHDGKFLTYYESQQGVWVIWILPLGGDRKPYRPVPSSFNQVMAHFSPDGKWLTYCSGESGRMEVYAAPFPGPGGKWQVSTTGGCQPTWRKDGKEIFYLATDNRLMAAEVTARGSSVEVGAVRPLFEMRPFRAGGMTYDVAPDGQRFSVNYSVEDPNAALTLVLNWNAEIK